MEKQDVLLGAGAAGVTVLPGVVTAVLPQSLLATLPSLWGEALPVLATGLPGCTGVCGACGGGCLGGAGALAWLAVCAKVKSCSK